MANYNDDLLPKMPPPLSRTLAISVATFDFFFFFFFSYCLVVINPLAGRSEGKGRLTRSVPSTDCWL